MLKRVQASYLQSKVNMKSTNLVALIYAITIFVSCKKDTKNELKEDVKQPVIPASYPNYSNLKVGNYWIYERFVIDTLGNATSLAIIDSCYIEKDTVIRNEIYYKLTGPEFSSMSNPTIPSQVKSGFIRDSLSYLISSHGDILFSSQDFTTVFNSTYSIIPPNDTVYRAVTKMNDKDISITTPSGSYVTSSFQTSYTFYNNYIIYSVIRNKNIRYAENVGMVTQDWGFYSSSPNYWQRQLIRYHFN